MKKLFLVPFLFLLVGCNKVDNWTAIYYPDKNDLDFYTKQSGWIDLEACQDNAMYLGTENGLVGLENGTYECGKNCEFNLDLEMFICEETIK